MPEWLFDFLSGPTIKIAEAIWNSSMRLIIKLVCSTPQKFSTGTWAFVKENLYPWAEGIGLSALNLFFMIAFLKAVSNLHQNITLEMVIEAMVKVVVANVLYLNILNIMTTVFSISSAMAKEVFTLDAPELKVEDMDIGSALFYQLFGLLFILAAIVCSFLMLWTVYSRHCVSVQSYPFRRCPVPPAAAEHPAKKGIFRLVYSPFAAASSKIGRALGLPRFSRKYFQSIPKYFKAVLDKSGFFPV